MHSLCAPLSPLLTGGNSCPPVLVGVGIVGTQEKAALLAKEAPLRSVGERI